MSNPYGYAQLEPTSSHAPTPLTRSAFLTKNQRCYMPSWWKNRAASWVQTRNLDPAGISKWQAEDVDALVKECWPEVDKNKDAQVWTAARKKVMDWVKREGEKLLTTTYTEKWFHAPALFFGVPGEDPVWFWETLGEGTVRAGTVVKRFKQRVRGDAEARAYAHDAMKGTLRLPEEAVGDQDVAALRTIFCREEQTFCQIQQQQMSDVGEEETSEKEDDLVDSEHEIHNQGDLLSDQLHVSADRGNEVQESTEAQGPVATEPSPDAVTTTQPRQLLEESVSDAKKSYNNAVGRLRSEHEAQRKVLKERAEETKRAFTEEMQRPCAKCESQQCSMREELEKLKLDGDKSRRLERELDEAKTSHAMELSNMKALHHERIQASNSELEKLKTVLEDSGAERQRLQSEVEATRAAHWKEVQALKSEHQSKITSSTAQLESARGQRETLQRELNDAKATNSRLSIMRELTEPPSAVPTETNHETIGPMHAANPFAVFSPMVSEAEDRAESKMTAPTSQHTTSLPTTKAPDQQKSPTGSRLSTSSQPQPWTGPPSPHPRSAPSMSVQRQQSVSTSPGESAVMATGITPYLPFWQSALGQQQQRVDSRETNSLADQDEQEGTGSIKERLRRLKLDLESW